MRESDRRARVRVLGSVGVVHDGAEVALGGAVVRLLLAHLAIAGAAGVSDERLMQVWDETSDDPSSVLRVTINRLRKRLDGTGLVVERRPGGYLLHGGTCDVAELADIEQALDAAGDPGEIERLCVAGLRLWGAAALADLRSVAVADRLAITLDRRRSQLRRRLAEVTNSTGRLADHLDAFTQWVDDDPLDDVAARSLAEALAAAGQSAAALRSLRAHQRALADIGLDASTGVAELEIRLLDMPITAAAPQRVSARRLPPALRAHIEKRLVGRDDLLDRLRDQWEQVDRGMSGAVRLSGYPGVGKTAIAANCADRLHREGVVVSYANCRPTGSRPFGVVSDWLSGLDGADGSRDWTFGDHADLEAAIATAVSRARGALEAGVDGRRVLLVVDDVQWADESSIAVIRHILDRPLSGSVLLLMTERAGAPTLMGHRGATSIEVDVLDESTIGEWVDRAFDPHEVMALTGGLPLLIEELMRSGTQGVEAAGIVLFEDLAAGMTSTTLDVLTAAAILGPVVRFSELAVVVAEPELDVVDRVDALIRRGVLRDDMSGSVAFVHELFRDAALARWSALRQERTHAQILATVLAEPLAGEAPEPARVLRHSIAAGSFALPERMFRAALDVASQQVSGCSFTEAQATLEIARSLLDSGSVDVGPAEQADVFVLSARCASVLRSATDMHRHIDRAVDIARTAADDQALAIALPAQALRGLRHTPDAISIVEAAELFRRLTAEDAPMVSTARLVVLARFAALAVIYGGSTDRFVDVRSGIERILAMTELDESDRGELLDTDYMLVSLTGEPDDIDRASARLDHFVSTSPGLPPHAALVLNALSVGEPAGEAIESMSDSAERLGYPRARWVAQLARATVAFVESDLDLAGEHAVEALAMGRRLGLVGVFGAYSTQQFAIGWARGDLAAFVEPLEAALGSTGAMSEGLSLRGGLALALASTGETTAAEALLDADEIEDSARHWIGIVGLSLACEAAWMVDDVEFLTRSAPVFARYRDRHIILGHGAMDYGPASRYLALCQHRQGSIATATATLERLRESRSSGTIWQARAQADLDILARSGDLSDERPAPSTDGPWRWLMQVPSP